MWSAVSRGERSSCCQDCRVQREWLAHIRQTLSWRCGSRELAQERVWVAHGPRVASMTLRRAPPLSTWCMQRSTCRWLSPKSDKVHTVYQTRLTKSISLFPHAHESIVFRSRYSSVHMCSTSHGAVKSRWMGRDVVVGWMDAEGVDPAPQPVALGCHVSLATIGQFCSVL